MFNGQCLTRMATSSRWSSGQDMGFGGLRMANSKSGDYNLLSSGKVLEFVRGPQCWFHEIEISAMYNYIPLGLNQLLNVGVDQWFQICIMDTCQWVYVLIKGLFCTLVPLSFHSMPQWLGIQQKWTCVPLVLNNQSRFMVWRIKEFSVSSPSIACKQDIESE